MRFHEKGFKFACAGRLLSSIQSDVRVGGGRLYESSREVNMVDGLPHAPSIVSKSFGDCPGVIIEVFEDTGKTFKN